MINIKHITISSRILLSAAIPIIALICAAGILGSEKWNELSSAKSTLPFLRLTAAASSLVHELQKERGTSTGWLASRDDGNARTKMNSQRSMSDGALRQFKTLNGEIAATVLSTQLAAKLVDIDKQLDGLSRLRSNVEGRIFGTADAVREYAALIRHLIGSVSSLIREVDGRAVISQMQAYRALMIAKEFAGIERATGNGIASSGILTQQSQKMMIEAMARQSDFLEEFFAFATDEQAKVFASVVTPAIEERVATLRDRLLGLESSGGSLGVSSEQWWSAVTARIDALKVVETSIGESVQSSAQASLSRTKVQLSWLLAAISFVLIAVSLIAIAIGRSVARPLSRLTGSMSRIADGDLDDIVPELGRTDELGAMARAIEHFRMVAKERHRLEGEQTQTRDKEEERRKILEREIFRFRNQVGEVVGALNSQTSRMGAMSRSLSDAATATTEMAKSASQATAGAADNSQAVAAASEQLGGSIREIATQAHRASDIVTQTTDAARATNDQLSKLAAAAESIGSIIQIIRGVAEQTNLLALNATIEAARAGESGKGFAVVATEVKALAAQTAKATDQIAAQINEVQHNSAVTVDAVKAIGSRVDDISGLTVSIATAVEEQEHATNEIARNVTSAADHSRTVAEGMTGVQQAADETRTQAEGIADTSRELAEITRRIGASFDEFIKAIGNDIEERRKSARRNVNWKTIVLTASGGLETKAQDVGLGGLRIATVPGLVVGGSVKVDFGVGFREAKVIWTNPIYTGLQFDVAFKDMPNVEQQIDAASKNAA